MYDWIRGKEFEHNHIKNKKGHYYLSLVQKKTQYKGMIQNDTKNHIIYMEVKTLEYIVFTFQLKHWNA